MKAAGIIPSDGDPDKIINPNVKPEVNYKDQIDQFQNFEETPPLKPNEVLNELANNPLTEEQEIIPQGTIPQPSIFDPPKENVYPDFDSESL
jgi:hypothetical protein